ncbi:MAG: hypothetical protein FWB80_02905 [Defluviitaleaceae bacterium]|nr:hypothetical protein [Defluviitaleaceae bacterium]
MPLVFPPAPNAFFNRAKEQQTVVEHKEEAGFRYYPLACDAGPGRGGVTVEPLQPPVPPHRIAPLQHLIKPRAQTMSPMAQMQPMIPPPPMTSHPMMQQMKTPMIPPMPQQMFPQMPPQATSPQKAAEQFHQMNKNLPDGVKYEPLDDEIMKILREKSPHFKDLAAPPSQSPAQPALPLPPEAVEILKGMAQCEKSMYAFFKNFPDNAELAALAEASEKRLERLDTIINSPLPC